MPNLSNVLAANAKALTPFLLAQRLKCTENPFVLGLAISAIVYQF